VLRDAVARKYQREQRAAVAPGERHRDGRGRKQAVYNVCQALFEEGDAVVLFSPYWVSVPEMVRLTGAEPVFVPTRLERAGGWTRRRSTVSPEATSGASS
jgi:aspartate aminotransferase